jgi:hypothetical protein
MTRTAAELQLITHKHHGLTMNWKTQKENRADPLWLAALSFALDRNLAAAGRKYKQALRLARITATSRYRAVAPMAITDVAQQIPILAMAA